MSQHLPPIDSDVEGNDGLDFRLFGSSKPHPLMQMVTYLGILLNIPVYVCLTFALSALYFVVTGVQFWGTAYLQSSLGGTQYQANLLFIFTSATGPTAGVFFGGWVVDYMGGYKGSCSRSRTMKLCACLGLLSCTFGIPATFVREIYTFTAMLWLMLFFGGSVLPGCTGIALSVVPRPLRPVSSSVSLVVFNLFGYSLSLILSGSLMQMISNNVKNCDYACSLEHGFR